MAVTRCSGCFADVLLSLCRVVSSEEGQKKAEEEGALFMETSAKHGYNIKPLFRKIATALPGMEKTTVTNDSNCKFRWILFCSFNRERRRYFLPVIDITLAPRPPEEEEEEGKKGGCC